MSSFPMGGAFPCLFVFQFSFDAILWYMMTIEEDTTKSVAFEFLFLFLNIWTPLSRGVVLLSTNKINIFFLWACL